MPRLPQDFQLKLLCKKTIFWAVSGGTPLGPLFFCLFLFTFFFIFVFFFNFFPCFSFFSFVLPFSFFLYFPSVFLFFKKMYVPFSCFLFFFQGFLGEKCTGWVKSYLRTRIARLVPSMRRLTHLNLVSLLFSCLDLLFSCLSSSLFSLLFSFVFFSCLLLLSRLLLSLLLSRLLLSCPVSLSLSLFLCLSLSLSVPVCPCRSLCCCGGCCCLVCMSLWSWCGTLKTPCVLSKRPRVYRTCGRGAGAHGDVLNLHTAGVLNVHTERGVGGEEGVSVTHQHQHQHTHEDPHNAHQQHTTHNTRHRTREVSSPVLLTKICPRKVVT